MLRQAKERDAALFSSNLEPAKLPATDKPTGVDDPWEESWDGTQDASLGGPKLLNPIPVAKCLKALLELEPKPIESGVGGTGSFHEKGRSSATMRDVARSKPSSKRQLWSFGQNSYGELAHGDTKSRHSPQAVDSIDGDTIIQVAAGNEHTIVLTKSGLVYSAGYNDNGQCGQGGVDRVGELQLIEDLQDKHIVQVHAYNGCEHTLAVSADGQLYSFGYNYRGQLGVDSTSSVFVPQLVQLGKDAGRKRKVKNVSCSYYHSIILCEDGDMYAFGRNDFGQLGLGDTADRKTPTRIDTSVLHGAGVKAFSCGQYHTLVVTARGAMYACGKNDYGQLGLSSSESQRRLTVVRAPSLLIDNAGGATQVTAQGSHAGSLVGVNCGYYHTLGLLRNGTVVSFGRNDYGQLGQGHNTQRVFGAKVIEALLGKNVMTMAAGCYHSIVVDDAGTIYTFGRNNHGQLGTGDDIERHSPCRLASFQGCHVQAVAAGFYHSLILTGRHPQSHASTSSSAMSAASSGADHGEEAKPFDSMYDKNAHELIDFMGTSLSAGCLNAGSDNVAEEGRHSRGRAARRATLDARERPDRSPSVERSRNQASSAMGQGSGTLTEQLCDEAVSPEVAAIMILGHLDRMAQPYMREYGIYPALEWISHAGSVPAHAQTMDDADGSPQKSQRNGKQQNQAEQDSSAQKASGSASQGFPGGKAVDADNGSECLRESFSIEISPKAFRSILSLLSLCGASVERAGILSIQPNVLLTCLRLLRANMTSFVGHASAALASAGMAQTLAALKDKLLSYIDGSQTEPVLQYLGNKVGGQHAIDNICKEAAETLVIGLQVFYPLPSDIINLFSDLVGAEDDRELAKRQHLLPLLVKRLADDDLMASIFPAFNGADDDSALAPIMRLAATLMSCISREHDEMFMGIAMSASEQGAHHTRLPYVSTEPSPPLRVLLCLQKHMLSWAGTKRWRKNASKADTEKHASLTL